MRQKKVKSCGGGKNFIRAKRKISILPPNEKNAPNYTPAYTRSLCRRRF